MGSSFALFLFWMNRCRFGLWRTLIMIHHLTTSSLPHLLNSGPLTALQHTGGIHSWVLCTATGEFIVVLPSLLVISTLVIVILYSLLFWCYLSSLSHAMFSSDHMTRYLGELFSYFLEHFFFVAFLPNMCLLSEYVIMKSLSSVSSIAPKFSMTLHHWGWFHMPRPSWNGRNGSWKQRVQKLLQIYTDTLESYGT